MISFHTSLPECPAKVVVPQFEPSSKKRKWEDSPREHLFFREQGNGEEDRIGIRHTRRDIELNLDAPLPSEWQQCLDIQSGKIHFFNTRTSLRTSRDPRRSPAVLEAIAAATASENASLEIDLELNLTCESLGRVVSKQDPTRRLESDVEADHRLPVSESDDLLGVPRCPSWLSVETERREMVATACMKCHMLVMLCKASPACPNCKFMHSLNQNSPSQKLLL